MKNSSSSLNNGDENTCKSKNIEILENTSLDIPSLIDDLRFKYQYSLRYQSNHAAFSKKNDNGNYIMCCCPNHTETRPSFGISKTLPITHTVSVVDT